MDLIRKMGEGIKFLWCPICGIHNYFILRNGRFECEDCHTLASAKLQTNAGKYGPAKQAEPHGKAAL
jgi:hypothetical protein